MIFHCSGKPVTPGRIRLYEVWNEPDLDFWRGTTDEYIRLLRSAYEEIHRVDPKAMVMTGGFATVLNHAGRAKNPDLQERVLAEASEYFDIHAFHQHGAFPEFKGAVEGELQRIRARMTHPRPLYYNETALTSAFWGEKTQATTLVKKIAYVMASGAVGHTWYDLRNDGGSPDDQEQNYGLLTGRFEPKPSYAAYMEVVRQLHGMRRLGDLDLGSEREAHVFGSARGRVVVWWNEGRNASEIPVFFRCGNTPIRVVDIMGNARQLPQVDDVAMAQVTSEPQYLQFAAGEGLPAIAGTLVRLDGPSEAVVGEPVKLTAQLTNPLKREIRVTLSWRDARGRDTSVVIPVPAGGTAAYPVSAPPPSASALVHDMDLRFAAADTPWSGSLHRSVPVMRLFGDAPPDGRDADWVLDRASDVVDLCQADPALNAFTWRGPDDFSARIWAWRQNGALRVRVDVRDNIHVQNETAENMWRGDSVQLALQVPGTKGYWEIGAAQDQAGRTLKVTWTTPEGIQGTEDLFTAVCQSIPNGMRYDLTLPCNRFGLTDQVCLRGFRFNLLVNDSNSKNLRRCFARIAPGIGESKDPNAFPFVRFAK